MASGVVNLIKIAIQLALLPVMARLLGPNEFGLFALALPAINFVVLLADAGLGATLAREEESFVLVWSSAFWALLLVGLGLALGTTVFGFFMGYIAHQPRLPGIIALLSLSLVFLSLSVVPSARLARRKNLTVGAGADLTANVTAAIVAVTMAAHGAGAWSLAAQFVTLNALRSLILNFAALHLPRLAFSLQTLRPHIASGGTLVGSRLCEFGGRITETLIVDRIFGTALLGSYTFANQISKFSAEAVSNTIWAALYVQALTSDKDKIILLHRKLCRLLGIALFPTTFLAAAAAPQLVDLLLGSKWPDLAFFIRIYLLLYTFSAISVQSAPILLAYGRYGVPFWCVLGLSLGRIISVGLGHWFGLTGAMYSMVIVTVLFCLAMLVFPAKETGCRPLPMLLGLVRPLISSLIATGIFLQISNVLPKSLTWTLVCLTLGIAVFAMSMALIDRKSLKDDWDSVRRVMSPRKAQNFISQEG
jgi:O-antigen/teichoic acid export membrane protein